MFHITPSKVLAILAISIATGVVCVPAASRARQSAQAVANDVPQPLRREKNGTSGLTASKDEVRVTLRAENHADLALAKLKPLAASIGEVTSAPLIRKPILGGANQISGNVTIPEARDFALTPRSGTLPAKRTLVEKRSFDSGSPQGPPRWPLRLSHLAASDPAVSKID